MYDTVRSTPVDNPNMQLMVTVKVLTPAAPRAPNPRRTPRATR